MRAVLTRLRFTDDGVFGEFVVYDAQGVPVFRCVTGELPWRDNQPDLSCIPEGVYRAFWEYSPKHGRFLFHLHGVAGRSVIEIHAANLMGDAKLGKVAQLLGCIAPGQEVLTFRAGTTYSHGAPPLAADQLGVTASGDTLAKLEAVLGTSPFDIEVRRAAGAGA